MIKNNGFLFNNNACWKKYLEICQELIILHYLLTIWPEIGRKTEAIAELLANSVVKEAVKLTITTTDQKGK